MQELEDQVRDYATGKEITRKVFPHQIAFNVFSHDTKMAENGYNEEENKVIEEMRKMFHMPHLAVVPTCIRVPVLRAHSEAITLELDKPIVAEEARGILALAPGVKLVDDAAANHFPMPIEASGDLDVHVGRIRRDSPIPTGWCCSWPVTSSSRGRRGTRCRSPRSWPNPGRWRLNKSAACPALPAVSRSFRKRCR